VTAVERLEKRVADKKAEAEKMVADKKAEAEKMASMPIVKRVAPKPVRIFDESTIYGFAQVLVGRLYKEYGYNHSLTVFRNRKTSYTRMRVGGPQVIFGYESITRAFKEGFRDYKTIQRVWGDQYSQLVGLKGVWALVLHEFAHVVQFAEDNLFSENGHRNRYHNEQFLEALTRLQALFPFQEMDEGREGQG